MASKSNAIDQFINNLSFTDVKVLYTLGVDTLLASVFEVIIYQILVSIKNLLGKFINLLSGYPKHREELVYENVCKCNNNESEYIKRSDIVYESMV